jgi:hypothetical protein
MTALTIAIQPSAAARNKIRSFDVPGMIQWNAYSIRIYVLFHGADSGGRAIAGCTL